MVLGRAALRETNGQDSDPTTVRKASAPALSCEAVPPSLDGERTFVFAATKKAAVAGKNGGRWQVKAFVKVNRRVTFKHRFDLMFNLDDSSSDRDEEASEQLRESMVEFYHRATAAPKTAVFLESGHDFAGARQVKLVGRKFKKNKAWHFKCSAEAHCDYGVYDRVTNYVFHSDTDAARTSAAALLVELCNAWAHATRSKSNDEHLEPAQNGRDLPQRPARTPMLAYLRDVYGANSNVDQVVQRRR